MITTKIKVFLITLMSLLTFISNAQEVGSMQNAIISRHAVRSYKEEPLPVDIVSVLNNEISKINAESGLNIQLVLNEPRAFSNFLATYGRFKGVSNYFALVGKKNEDKLLEKMGYYGEKLVLLCQILSLNTCWVGGTFKKIYDVVDVPSGETFVAVITVGYGQTTGVAHKSKPIEEFTDDLTVAPPWFRSGVEYAMLGPSALNKQDFYFTYEEGRVSIHSSSKSSYSAINVGIAKLHFEIGSQKDSTIWKD